MDKSSSIKDLLKIVLERISYCFSGKDNNNLDLKDIFDAQQ